jgi:hypothetical protein
MKKLIEKIIGWQLEYNYYPGQPSNFELWREEVGHWRVQLGSYEVFLISRKHPHFHYQ